MSRTSAAATAVDPDVHVENAESAARPTEEKTVAEGPSEFAGIAMESSAGMSTGMSTGMEGSEERGEETGEAERRPQHEDIASLCDHDLLEGIRDQSELHFAELYNRYFQRIYNFVYARMRNHAETEEVVQETFLAVFRSFDNYRGQSSLLSWIYGIAKNTTNNNLRRAKSQSARLDLADEEDLMPRPSLDVGMPDEQLDLLRFRESLNERLDSLASWQTEIFEMRHFENLSIPEISQRTQRSSDAVRSSLYRVKRMFLEAAAPSGSNAAGGAEPTSELAVGGGR